MTLIDDVDEVASKTKPPPHLVPPGWRVDVTPDGATLSAEETKTKIVAADDWDGVLRHFGLNPSEFEICDDTVRMSSWEQSKGHEDGTRDVITLYSYRARFKKITDRLPETDVAALRKRIDRWKPRTPRQRAAGSATPCTFYIGWADWQLGKSAGGGYAVTQQRVLDSIELSIARVKELRRAGRNVTSLAVANMGDPTEGCDGNYASQLFSVELTRREQLNLALDLWATGLRELAPLFDDVEFISVLCNHGEWTRQGPGTKAVTTDSDNIGGYLADTLRRVLDGRPGFDHVRFTVPHDEMTVLTDMSGIPVALAHGHKMPGSPKELDWLRGQSIRLLREHGREPLLWMTAHRHHLDVKDFGPWTRLQHTTLDGGSKWHEDTTGLWSTPGTLTCLVGEHPEAGARRFSDLAVLL